MEKEFKAAAEWWAAHVSVSVGADLAAFERTLVAAFQEAWDGPDWDDWGWGKRGSHYGAPELVVHVDYEPMEMLQKAADDAGLIGDDPMFPRKTVMWIEPGKVTVRDGYAAELQVIYDAAQGGEE
jgi:hypothetical protein